MSCYFHSKIALRVMFHPMVCSQTFSFHLLPVTLAVAIMHGMGVLEAVVKMGLKRLHGGSHANLRLFKSPQ